MNPFKNELLAQHWKEYALSFLILALLGALPAIMFGANLLDYLYPYGLLYALYWAVVAGGFTFLTVHQRKKAFAEPLAILGDATKKVAGGDFSVYLKPIFSLDQSNYIDRLFADFNTMVAELGSLETMKTDFITNVSHEIKTPLAKIQGYARLLQEQSITESDRINDATSLMRASSNLSSLVTNMLQLSKLENQGILSSREPFNVCEQLTDTLSTYIDLWEQKGIQYAIDLDDYAMIEADPALVDIIWRNLLSNATKFTPAGQSITIQQTSTETAIQVIIRDTGQGMNAETLKHLFEKFYQGDSSHSSEGNGLGMALVYRSIELLGGTIEIESSEGKGTACTVTLNALIT